jgi:hypothetical protein
MISHKYKCIFIHIPKTAGKSIEVALEGRTIIDPHFNKIFPKYKGPIKAYGDFYRRYFKFAFVRNPWDRLVSVYHYYLNGGNKTSTDRKIQKNIPRTFREFVLNLKFFTHSYILAHLIEQADYIADGNDNMLVDFVGKYESLEKDFQRVCKKIGLKSNLHHLNQSGHYHYSKYYDSETKEIIGAMYRRDIKLFNYKFEDNKKLFAGPWIGEFGHELFNWQAFIRTLSKKYTTVVVASRPDREFLYRDFCTEFIPESPKNGIPNMASCKHCKHNSQKLWQQYGAYDIVKPTHTAIRRLAGTGTFIKFGKKDESLQYDILIHARYRKWRFNENWSKE